jgi:hypothetical protein
VESSADGQHFSRLGTVPGQGTTAQSHTYALTDYTLARYGAATVYYRLRQVDRDGTAAVSPVRAVRLPAPATPLLVQAYPNPCAGPPTVRIEATQAGPAWLTLRDATGRLLHQQPLTLGVGRNEVRLAAADLPLGLYLLSVTQQTYQHTVRLTRE